MARDKAVRKSIARSMAKSGWEPMRAIIRGEKGVPWPAFATRVYQNNRYTVMVNDAARSTKGPVIQAYVSAHNTGRDVFWKDLQRIKNEVFGEEAVAVQYFPRESKLVDLVNVYWLFVYPAGVLPEPIV